APRRARTTFRSATRPEPTPASRRRARRTPARRSSRTPSLAGGGTRPRHVDPVEGDERLGNVFAVQADPALVYEQAPMPAHPLQVGGHHGALAGLLQGAAGPFLPEGGIHALRRGERLGQ